MLTRQRVEKQQYPSESSSEYHNKGILYDSTNNINNIKSHIVTNYRPYHRPITDTSSVMHPPPIPMASSPHNNHKKNDTPRSGMCDGGSSDNGIRSTVGVYRRNSMGRTFYGSQHHRPRPPPPPPPPRSFGAPPLNAGYAQRRFSCSSMGIERVAHHGVSSHPPATLIPQAAPHWIGGGTNNANKNNHRSDGVGSHSFLNSHAPAPASGSSFESASISSGGGHDDHNGSKCSSPYGNNIQVHSYRPQSKISSPRHSADQNDSTANRPTSNNPYQKPTKSSLTNNLLSLLSTLLFLTLVTLFPVTLHYRHTYNSLQQRLELAGNINHRRPQAKQQIHGTTQQQNELSTLQNDVAALTIRRDHLKSQYEKFTGQMQTKIDVAERERENLKHEIEVHNIALAHSQEEMDKFKAMTLGRKKLESFVIKREEVLWEKIDGLKEMVAKFSHREGVDWFGEGPHRVEITLEYPQYTPGQDISTWPRNTKPFIVELAPLSIMPHTVTFFLSQVYHKLWDGIRLHHNLQHIYHFAPSSNINESGVDTPSVEYQRFQDRKLDKVIFQEYHHEYPHEAWTLGFSGRPGGTEFYINKLNNTFNHGPGGQTDDVYSDADPCFGKVVEGWAVFGEIDKIPENSLIQGVVVIQSIRPLFAEKNPVDERLKKKMETLGVGQDGLMRWLSR